MSLIEQATKRLEELRRAGVAVPWSAAGLPENKFDAMVSGQAQAPGAAKTAFDAPEGTSLPATAARRIEELRAVPPTDAPVVHALPKRVPEAPSVVRSASLRQSQNVTIDLDRLRSAGYLVPDIVRSDLAEEFRHLKRPLLKNVRASSGTGDRRESLIMVTSALPGEGKTFCAANLAMSIAMEVDSSVLLVDADVVRPALLKRLGVSEERKGLLDLLIDDGVELPDVMLRTNVPKLSILPAGAPHNKSTEWLASAAMEQLLSELATHYSDRVVIFDAPPLLPTTQSRALASRMGQVVMVVDAGSTSRASVKAAFAAVEQCPIVMSVLNRCRDPFERGQYGYYY